MSDSTASSGSLRYWIAGLAIVFGVLVGLSLFTFVYAEGFSYFSNDPNACMNCHIMRDQFDGWSHSTHKAVAACNDCHTPHRFPDKYIVKGINGFNHSLAFTLGTYPENLHIREFNADIAYENCVECHSTAISSVAHITSDDPLNCVMCHGNVGHDNVAYGQ
jgi:cytochrome c nitrite reductase small subunit